MSLIIPANTLSGGYAVDNSCRFDDGSSDYLSRTPGSASNRTTWTWSCWIKRANLTGTQMVLFGAKQDGSNDSGIWIETDNTLKFFNNVAATVSQIRTNRVFRDVSAWYHIVCVWDSSNATAGDRMKMYINGVEETSFQTDDNPVSSDNSMINNTQLHQIGRVDSTYYFDGYLAEMVFIDGQALDPTSFGEFDEDSGIWKPINVSGLTFGTNGFYLDFEDSAALGDDVSGNGNDFTVNNLTAIDQTTDTPTNNFATLNFLTKNNDTALSNGNLTATGTDGGINGTVGSGTLGIPSSGKWYYEIKVTNIVSSSYPRSGLISVDDTQFGRLLNAEPGTPGYTTNQIGFYVNGTKYYNNSESASWGSALSNNDIIQWYVDMDNGAVYVGINDTVQNSGNPSSGASKTGAIWTFTAGTYTSLMPATSDYNGSVQNFNFGNAPYAISSGNTDGDGYGNFEYAVPSGYFALCTKNLAEYG